MNSDKQPLVSIVIPCFNAQEWVEKAIESCLEQSYARLEILVIDDGSTDQSFNIIQKYAKEIYCETGPRQGGNRARNRGLKLSKGEYVQFLDADDLLDGRKIKRQVDALGGSQTADAIVGSWSHLIEYKKGYFKPGPLKIPRVGSDPICSLILNHSWAPLCAYLYRKEKLIEIGGWDESLICMQDVDLNLRLLMSGAGYLEDEGFCGYYRRPMALTTSTRNTAEFMRQCVINYLRAEECFEKSGWTMMRRNALAQCFFFAARYYARSDQILFRDCLSKIEKHQPEFTPEGPRIRALVRLLGRKNALYVDALAWTARQMLRRLIAAT